MAVALQEIEINSQPDVNPIMGVIKTKNVDPRSILVVYGDGTQEFIPFEDVPDKFLPEQSYSPRSICLGNFAYK